MKRIRGFTIPDGMTFSDFKLALYIRRTNKRCAADRKRWETFMRRNQRTPRPARSLSAETRKRASGNASQPRIELMRNQFATMRNHSVTVSLELR